MAGPTYSNKHWDYPEDWAPDSIIEHALRFALNDYLHLSRRQAHPMTLGPAALLDALHALHGIRAEFGDQSL